MTYTDLKAELGYTLELIEKLDTKWTKSNSARVRKQLQKVKNATTAIRRELIEKDKAQ